MLRGLLKVEYWKICEEGNGNMFSQYLCAQRGGPYIECITLVAWVFRIASLQEFKN